MWQQRVYITSPEFMTMTSCDSICCMCGEACRSCWLIMQLTNGQHSCMLCSCQWWTFWTYLVPVNLISLYLMSFVFHTTLDAVGNILRVRYKNMKCDVSFPQGSITTLFRLGVFHVYVKMFFLLIVIALQKLYKSNEFFQSNNKCSATFFMKHSVPYCVQTEVIPKFKSV